MSISTASTGSTVSNPASDVKNRNNLVFKKFEKVFGNLDNRQFAEYVNKFAHWLRDEKGYYAEAQGSIVRLAMIVQYALRRALNVDQSLRVPFPPELYLQHPMSGPYQKLVRTIYGHAHLFKDPEHHKQLESLFTSAHLPYAPPNAPNSPTIESQTPAVQSSQGAVVPPQARNVPQTETPSTEGASAVLAQTTPPVNASTVQPRVHEQGHMSTMNTANQTQLPLQVTIPRPENKHDNGQPTSSACTGEPETTSPTISKMTRKKKRKKLDLDSLAEIDVKNYIAKQEHAQGLLSPQSAVETTRAPEQPQPIANGILQDQVGQATSSAPGQGLLQLNVQEPCNTGNAASRNVIEIHDTPEPPAQATTATTFVKPEPRDDVLPQANFVTTIVNDKEVIDLTLSDDEDTPRANGQAHVVVQEPTIGEYAMDDDEPSPEPEPLPEDPSRRALSPEAPSPPPPQQNGIHAEASTRIDSESDRMTVSAATTVPPSESPPPSRTITIVGHSMVDKEAEHSSRPGTREWEAPGDASGDVHMADSEDTTTNGERPSQEPIPAVLSQLADERIYGAEMKVVTFQRGLACKGRVRFTFDVNEDDHALLQLWTKQAASISELRRSLCISLACYPVAQINPGDPLEPQLSSLMSSWPGQGGLIMKAQYKSNTEIISLSPPLLITPDSTVDVSMFVNLGSNMLEIEQTRNWSERVFVLLAHEPTENQIRKAQSKRDEDNAWQGWLKEMAQPIKLNISFPPLPALAKSN